MLNTEINRLRQFMQNDPVSVSEVTRCIDLAAQRAAEIAEPYLSNLEAMPTQLKGEIGMLKQLIEHMFDVGAMILLRQRMNLCEQMIQPVLDVSLVGTPAISLH